MATLTQVKAVQPKWFSRKNKKFFGDVRYWVLHGKRTGEPYLIRSTYAWTDMFGQKPRLHYRINRLEDNLKISSLLDDEFENMPAVKRWLKENYQKMDDKTRNWLINYYKPYNKRLYEFLGINFNWD